MTYMRARQLGQRLYDICVAGDAGRTLLSSTFSLGKLDPMQWGLSSYQDNRLVQAYISVSNRLFDKMPHFFCSVDKARIYGGSLFGCIAVAPSNVAAWGAPLDSFKIWTLRNILFNKFTLGIIIALCF